MQLTLTHQRTLAMFVAADPWRNNLQIEFRLEEYALMPPGSANQEFVGFLLAGSRVLLRTPLDGTQRSLPAALVELWRVGKVPAGRIPDLLHPIESSLDEGDYDLSPPPSLKSQGKLFAGLFVTVTLLVAFIAWYEQQQIPVLLMPGIGALSALFLIGAVAFAGWPVRSRRKSQTKWLLRVMDGTQRGRPPGKFAGRLKAAVLFTVIPVVAMGLIFGGAAIWYSIHPYESSSPKRRVASAPADTAFDLEMPLEISAGQAVAGAAIPVTVFATGDRLIVQIPAGIKGGARLRLQGKGRPAPDGAVGDLYLNVKVR
jgi:hypothetical protein